MDCGDPQDSSDKFSADIQNSSDKFLKYVFEYQMDIRLLIWYLRNSYKKLEKAVFTHAVAWPVPINGKWSLINNLF